MDMMTLWPDPWLDTMLHDSRPVAHRRREDIFEDRLLRVFRRASHGGSRQVSADHGPMSELLDTGNLGERLFGGRFRPDAWPIPPMLGLTSLGSQTRAQSLMSRGAQGYSSRRFLRVTGERRTSAGQLLELKFPMDSWLNQTSPTLRDQSRA